jgi:propanediol dehydratase small subunit
MLPADDKAKEIYEKMRPYTPSTYTPVDRQMTQEKYQAKQCALIAIDQIIEEVKLIYNGSYPTYWDYVKEEINAL